MYGIHLHVNSVPAKPLEVICAEYTQLRNARDLSSLRPAQFQHLRLFVRGLKVEVNVGNHKRKRPKAIKELIQDVGRDVFDKDGVPTTVAVCSFCFFDCGFHLTT